MSIKILQLGLVLVSTFNEFVEFSLSSVAQLQKCGNKQTLVKANISTVTFCSDYNNKNKPFWSENADMIFEFCNLHYFAQKFDTLS